MFLRFVRRLAPDWCVFVFWHNRSRYFSVHCFLKEMRDAVTTNVSVFGSSIIQVVHAPLAGGTFARAAIPPVPDGTTDKSPAIYRWVALRPQKVPQRRQRTASAQ